MLFGIPITMKELVTGHVWKLECLSREDPSGFPSLSKINRRGLRRKRRFEVLDEKGLIVVAIILPETKLELVIMGAIL